MNENLLVVGLQWGDEGKGKVIDALSEHYDVIARFQGGANAGHTVQVGDQTFVLHLIPSGILHTDKLCVIGNGLVVDPECLVEEVQNLKSRGIQVQDNLVISDRAHVVLPYHKMLDGLHEESLGKKQIQTTRRGIGPCYADKSARTGLRFVDMLSPDTLRTKLTAALNEKNNILSSIYGADPLDVEETCRQLEEYARQLRPYIRDTVDLFQKQLQEGKSILLEGAQGTMLDINFGTYPYVTSSNVSAGGAMVGTGIPPGRIDRVLGIVKAYGSRVGGGPFPTEQDNAIGERIRERGNEYGSTTGRPRRCGWLDGVALRYTAAINGVESIALMLLDVLSGMEEVKICTAYEIDGETVSNYPADLRQLEAATPIYKTLPGWQEDISPIRRVQNMPEAAR
jgi:adenylosuccinate synthase